MPKDRNQDTERLILASAWDLFMEKGFTETSYTDLAKHSGLTRSTVQYYAPKKIMLAEACFRAIFYASHNVAREHAGTTDDWFIDGYLDIQIMLAAYFASAGMRRFLRDVLYDRDLVHNLIELLFLMGSSEDPCFDLELEEIPDGITIAVGGLSELLFSYLKRGIVPEISSVPIVGMTIVAREFALQEPQDNLDKLETAFSSLAMTNEELAPLGERALDQARTILVNAGLPR